MKKTKKTISTRLKVSHSGVRGRRLKIEPEMTDSMLVSDQASLIQRGKVIAAGPETTAKEGDTIIFNAWGCDKITIDDKSYYYILDVDEFVLEIL